MSVHQETLEQSDCPVRVSESLDDQGEACIAPCGKHKKEISQCDENSLWSLHERSRRSINWELRKCSKNCEILRNDYFPNPNYYYDSGCDIYRRHHQNHYHHSSITQRESEESQKYEDEHRRRKCSRKRSILEDDNRLENKENLQSGEKYPVICISGQCNNTITSDHGSHPDCEIRLASQSNSSQHGDNCHTARGDGGHDSKDKNGIIIGPKDRTLYSARNLVYSVTAKSSLLNCHNKKRSNVIISSAAATMSLRSATARLCNFILFFALLVNSLNYCQVVQGEILSNSSLNKHPVGNQSGGRIKGENTYIYLEDGKISDRGKFGTSKASLDDHHLRNLLSKPLESLDKNVLIQALWDAMTQDEIHRIFGHHPTPTTSSFLQSVPNFDVTKPKVTHLNQEATRRKRRSPDFKSDIKHATDKEPVEKMIELEGLGRQFTLSLHANQKLLDPYFVHLHRHENRSEILSHELARKQLKCFYHGSANHNGKENDIETGVVAMSLCGGMKGFILPSVTQTSQSGGGGQQYHYVIHPLPDRLLKSVPARKPAERGEDRSSAADNEGHDVHHIIFRRPGTMFPNLSPPLAPPPLLSTLKDPENDTRSEGAEQLNIHSKGEYNHGLDQRRYGKPVSPVVNAEFSTCMHHDSPIIKYVDEQEASQQHRTDAIITSADLDDSDAGFNDLDSVTEEKRQSPTSREHNMGTSSGRSFRRAKRSTSFDTETIDPFTYKLINVAPDSYWLQFRDRGAGSRSGSTMTSSLGNYNNRRLSSQFSFDSGNSGGTSGPSRFTSPGGSSGPSFQPSAWQNQRSRNVHNPHHHNLPSRPSRGSRYDEIPTAPEYDDDTSVAGSDNTWSKGILVFESSASSEDRHYPGKDVPFYTKNSGKRKAKGVSTSSSVVASTSSTSSSSGSNTRSFDWFGGGVSARDTVAGTGSARPWTSLDKNRTSKSYSVSSDPSAPSRKGRRDDGLFGDKWKSSLDSDILWADRSNEINKQSRLDDISNVKDRPPSHLTIETAVFVDKDLYKHMQQNFPEDTQGEVTRIVLAMINAVQLLYQDPSLGHRVDFVLKRLEVLETDPAGLIRPYDIDRFLTNFCKWQKTENPASDADPLHWDHALILTGLDLYVVHQSGKISNQVVGLAPVAGMCTRSSSCTVNEGRHFESVFVVAHEIGHNLGMRHDGPQAENNCDPTSHIMSPTLGSGKITWSPCSKKYLDLFLETTQAKCLFDKAKSERWLDHDADGRLPGERFDADRQCVLKYGRGSFHATQQPLEDVCRDLHCRREFFTWTSHPALDGTRCSAADDMWCRAGKCVLKVTGSALLNSYELSSVGNNGNHDGFSGGSNHLPGSETAAYVTQKALDGGWGKWSPFTDCSSACLYSDDGTLTMGSTGVRLAARRCDSPRPENGGRQCSGPDRRYKSCAAHKICTKNPTRTTVSQYATEVCSRAAQVDTELTGRGYMSSSNDPERACSVWCETNDSSGPRSRGWSFPDGTSCKIMSLPKNAQTFCVAGKCQEFTCNPYSHFRLSEDDCAFSNSNDVIPNSNKNSPDWIGSSSGVKINHRSGKVGWSDWEIQSDCKLACLAPAKGLQLVKRQCAADDAICGGLSLSVRLCKPDKFTVQSNGCSRLQTPFEYATKICSKYADKVTGLSGIGMQLSPTKADSDRPCQIGCQDASIAYRFYMVNGEEGWFPAGTDCSRGDQDKKAYCMAGKCIDFGDDDTPMYQINNNMMSSLFQQTRNKRQAVYNIMEPLQTDPGLDELRLKELVHKFSQETGNYPSLVQRSRSISQRRSDDGLVDFSRPVVISSPVTPSSLSYSSSIRSRTNSPYTYSNPPNTNSLFVTKKQPSADSFSKNDHLRGRSLDMDFVDVKSEWWGAKPTASSFAHRSGQPSSRDGEFSFVTGGFTSQPIEGSYYEWRKIVSDCSVVCGTGIQEVIVQCVSGDTVVNDSLCHGRPRPGHSGYISCHKSDCGRSSSDVASGKGSHVWNWIQSILPPKNMSNDGGSRSY